MFEHAPELLQFALWIVGGLGALIVALFSLGVGIVRWAVSRYEGSRIAETESLNRRLDQQDETLKSIKDFIAKELFELREWFHRLDKDVMIIKERGRRGEEPASHRKADETPDEIPR